MKTRHIIAIGLLSALAVGLLAIGIKSGNKPKVQTKADNQITDLTGTSWYFNTTISMDNATNFYINFNSYEHNYELLLPLEVNQNDITLRYYPTFQNIVYSSANGGWQYERYRTITIIDGADVQSTRLINYLQTNAILITNNDWWTGYQAGYEVGYEEGETAGYNAGFTAGNTIGQQTGHAQGYETGYTAGETAGYTAGQTAGYETGYTAGETAGYETGYTAGETAGETAGYQTGYQTGYEAGLAASTEEAYQEGLTYGYATGWNDADAFDHPIAIAPLMMEVLTMPFTFISQAFDVTLWPGTEYQINIGNFIKAMLAIAAILFIIRLFTTGFSIIGNYTNNKTNKDLKVSQTNLNRAKTKQIQNNSTKK